MPKNDGKSKRRGVTELGRSIGILEGPRVNTQNEMYVAILFTREAQQFVVEKIGEILAYKAGRKSREQR